MNSLTVFFEDPFWVGVFERRDGNKLQAARVVFGTEPSDMEVYELIQAAYFSLNFSCPVAAEKKSITRPNPKRMQRKAARSVQAQGVGTKAQQALKQQFEKLKTERKQKSKAQRLANEERNFALAQEKRKEKHKGH